MEPGTAAESPRVRAAAGRAVELFKRRFGEPHLLLAYHAAVPSSLTPDLLYKLRVAFGIAHRIPWVAVADLLLSPLYVEVGHELYEPAAGVRDELLGRFQADVRFGPAQLGRVARFLLAYADQQQRKGGAAVFAGSQRWTARLILEPARALEELGARLDPRTQVEAHERGRLRRLVEVTLEQLRAYPEQYEAALRMLGPPPAPPAIERGEAEREEHGEEQASPLGPAVDAGLAASRWAIVVNALEDTALLRAVWPLVELRMAQMGIAPPAPTWTEGESCNTWWLRHSDTGKQTFATHWGAVPPVLIYRPGERVEVWLGRHGVSEGSRNVGLVPHYLTLIGRPEGAGEEDRASIPFDLQYDLALSHAVGRLCFTDGEGRHDLAGYAAYAERLVDYETGTRPARRHMVAFAPQHEDDSATRRMVEEIARPLTEGWGGTAPVAERFGFSQERFIADAATRVNLERILRGEADGGPPAVLLSTGHGLGLPLTSPELLRSTGAIVCHEWSGYGPVKREHYFAGEAVPADAALDGMVALLVNGFTAGSPQEDPFIFDTGRSRPQIAPYAFVAMLPQALLRQGAIGVVGHVERGWFYSVSGTNIAARVRDPSVFAELLALVLGGAHLGLALEPFVRQYRACSTQLTTELAAIRRGKESGPIELTNLWMAWANARSYVLLGDPAARLRLEERVP